MGKHRHSRRRRIDPPFAAREEACQVAGESGQPHDPPRSDPERLHPPCDPREHPPGIEIAHRVAAEDVATAAPPTGHRGEDPAGDVTNINKIVRAGGGEEPLAGTDLEEHPAARRLPVPRAEHVDRIDDHGVEPAGDLVVHPALGFPLRDHVRALWHHPRWRLLVGRRPVGPQSDRIDARDMDESSAGPTGGGGHDARPLDVRGGHLGVMPPAAVDHRGGVDHDPGPVDGRLHRPLVPEGSVEGLDGEASEATLRGLPRPDERPHRFAARDEHPHDIVTDQPGRPRHEEVDRGGATVGGAWLEGARGGGLGGGHDHGRIVTESQWVTGGCG